MFTFFSFFLFSFVFYMAGDSEISHCGDWLSVADGVIWSELNKHRQETRTFDYNCVVYVAF